MEYSKLAMVGSKPVSHSLQDIQQLSLSFMNGSDLSYLLSSSQILQLTGLFNHYYGIECLLKSWLINSPEQPQGPKIQNYTR